MRVPEVGAEDLGGEVEGLRLPEQADGAEQGRDAGREHDDGSGAAPRTATATGTYPFAYSSRICLPFSFVPSSRSSAFSA